MPQVIFDGRIVRDMLSFMAQRDRGEAAERQAERNYELDKRRVTSLEALNNSLRETEEVKREGLRVGNAAAQAELDEFNDTAGYREEQRNLSLQSSRAAIAAQKSATRINTATAEAAEYDLSERKRTQGVRDEVAAENLTSLRNANSLGAVAIDREKFAHDQAIDQQATRIARDAEKAMEAGDLRGAKAATDKIAKLYGHSFDDDMPLSMRMDEITRLSGSTLQLPVLAAGVDALSKATPSAEEATARIVDAIRGGTIATDPAVGNRLSMDAEEQIMLDEINYKLRRRARATLGAGADEAAIRHAITTDPEGQRVIDEALKNFPELLRVLESRPNVKPGDAGLDFVPIGETGAQIPTVNSKNGSRAPITQNAGEFAADPAASPVAAVSYGDKYDLLQVASTVNGGSIGLTGAAIEGLLASIAPTGSTLDEETVLRAQRTLSPQTLADRSRAMLFTNSDVGSTDADAEQRGRALASGEPLAPEAQRRHTQEQTVRIGNAVEDRKAVEAHNTPAARAARQEAFEVNALPRALDNTFARMTPETFEKSSTGSLFGHPATMESWRKGVPGHEQFLPPNPTERDRIKASATMDIISTLSDPRNAELIASVVGARGADPAQWDQDAVQRAADIIVMARMDDTSGNLFVDERYTVGLLTEKAVEAGIGGEQATGNKRFRATGLSSAMDRGLNVVTPGPGLLLDVYQNRAPEAPRGKTLTPSERLSIRDALR